MVDLRKDYETCDADGRKAVRFSAEIRADFETAQSYTVEYDFAVMAYRTFNASTGLLENSCTYNPFLPGCIGSATLVDAVPRGSNFQFLGFALQKFEMHTASGRPVELVRAKVDASVSIVMSPEDRQQWLDCGFAGQSDQGFEPFACSTRSVGIAAHSDWYNMSWLSRDKSLSYPNYQVTDAYPTASGVEGLASGLSVFDLLLNPALPAPVRSFSAGCFDPRYDPQAQTAYWDFEGSMMTAQPGFNAYIKCLNAWLKYP